MLQLFLVEKPELYMYKVNVFTDGERHLLHSICKRLNSFFSSETQKKICPMVRKKPYLSLFETEDGKVLSALCKCCSKVEYVK